METPDNTKIVCPKCNKEIAAGMEFCPFCGNKLINNQAGETTKSKLEALSLVIIPILVMIGGCVSCASCLESSIKKDEQRREAKKEVKTEPAKTKKYIAGAVTPGTLFYNYCDDMIKKVFKAEFRYENKSVTVLVPGTDEVLGPEGFFVEPGNVYARDGSPRFGFRIGHREFSSKKCKEPQHFQIDCVTTISVESAEYPLLEASVDAVLRGDGDQAIRVYNFLLPTLSEKDKKRFADMPKKRWPLAVEGIVRTERNNPFYIVLDQCKIIWDEDFERDANQKKTKK